MTLDSTIFRFLDKKPKAQATNDKVDKLGYIKIKYSCASNNILEKAKRQLTQWEKYLKIMYLTSDLYLELLQPINKKANNPIKNWAGCE